MQKNVCCNLIYLLIASFPSFSVVLSVGPYIEQKAVFFRIFMVLIGTIEEKCVRSVTKWIDILCTEL